MASTTICAAFCGTGKSYLSNTFPNEYQEIECWEYRKSKDFPNNYVEAVINKIDKVKYLLISTDPVILKELYKWVDSIILVYPDNSLKEEYMKRYCDRNSGYDFIGVMYKHWDEWLNELKLQNYCKHTILKSEQYLSDLLQK